jgi:hypothetical protein
MLWFPNTDAWLLPMPPEAETPDVFAGLWLPTTVARLLSPCKRLAVLRSLQRMIRPLGSVRGQIADRAVPKPRDDDGRWIGGSVDQWIDELSSAVIDYDAAGWSFLPADQPESAIHRWMYDIVPRVRRVIAA